MSETQNTSPTARLRHEAGRPARLIRTILQIVLGVGLAIALILKVYMLVLTDHVCTTDGTSLGNVIRCTGTLHLMAYVLAISAGFELAYRLFFDVIEQTLTPIALGFAAAVLFTLGRLPGDPLGWRDAIVLVVLTGAMVGIIWMRGRLVPPREHDS
ncbi:MAG: hypothetical protein AAFN27_21935 [Pseudomonadota bacterium]